jgi:hypothetical protein
MLLRRLRCDELGVCQARTPFCSGCFEVEKISTIDQGNKSSKMALSSKEGTHGLLKKVQVPSLKKR